MTGAPVCLTIVSARCSRQTGAPGQLSIGFDRMPSSQQMQQQGERSAVVMGLG
jgi:hypothetical protein